MPRSATASIMNSVAPQLGRGVVERGPVLLDGHLDLPVALQLGRGVLQRVPFFLTASIRRPLKEISRFFSAVRTEITRDRIPAFLRVVTQSLLTA